MVTITAVDNDVDAADKTVTVSATATGGNELVQAPGDETLTITDGDTRGITVSKATLTLDEVDNTATTEADEHQDTYTVVLDSEPSGGDGDSRGRQRRYEYRRGRSGVAHVQRLQLGYAANGDRDRRSRRYRQSG